MSMQDDTIYLTQTLLELSKTVISDYLTEYLHAHFEEDDPTNDPITCRKYLTAWKKLGQEVLDTEKIVNVLLPCLVEYVNNYLYDFKTYLFLLHCSVSSQIVLTEMRLHTLQGRKVTKFAWEQFADKALASRVAFIQFHTRFDSKCKEFFKEFGLTL